MVMANNLSSGLIIVGIGLVMMFIACKKKWIFILSMALGAAVFIFAPMIAMGLEKAGILEEIFQGYEEKKQAAEGIVTAVLRYTTLPLEEQKEKMEAWIKKDDACRKGQLGAGGRCFSIRRFYFVYRRQGI